MIEFNDYNGYTLVVSQVFYVNKANEIDILLSTPSWEVFRNNIAFDKM